MEKYGFSHPVGRLQSRRIDVITAVFIKEQRNYNEGSKGSWE